MKKHLPNALTCLNLLCGCAGVVAVLVRNEPLTASYLIGLAAVVDFLDGFLARLLKAYSPIGKELDSLADMVTFGLLPSIIVFRLLGQSLQGPEYDLVTYSVLPHAAFVIAVFSALRLAKFNVDPRQSDSFIGVPTPANALLIASLPLILRQHPDWFDFIVRPGFLIVFSVVMSLLLVAELPLLALKFKTFAFRPNAARYLFLGASAVLLLVLGATAVPVIIALYLVVSLAGRLGRRA
ncbi:MAG TPA: CDP-alcohol phosphatidyltransferase family protein [Cytophagales bacterium]